MSSFPRCLSNLFLNVFPFGAFMTESGNSFPTLVILTGKDCFLMFSFLGPHEFESGVFPYLEIWLACSLTSFERFWYFFTIHILHLYCCILENYLLSLQTFIVCCIDVLFQPPACVSHLVLARSINPLFRNAVVALLPIIVEVNSSFLVYSKTNIMRILFLSYIGTYI